MANCSNCGEPLKEGVKFCTSCGTAVKGGAPAKSAKPAKSATATKSATAAKSATASDSTPVPARSAAPDAATVSDSTPAPAMPARSVAPDATTDEVITTLGWFGTVIVLIVPIVGLVLYFVWAFGTGGNLNRRNYCRASLIMMAISIGLSIIFSVAFATLFAGILSFM